MRVSIILILMIGIFMPLDAVARGTQEIKKDIVKEKRKLKDVLGKIEDKKKNLEESALREKELLKELGKIEATIDKRDLAVAEVAANLSNLKKKIVKKSARTELLKKEKSNKEEWLRKRMVVLY